MGVFNGSPVFQSSSPVQRLVTAHFTLAQTVRGTFCTPTTAIVHVYILGYSQYQTVGEIYYSYNSHFYSY